MEGSREERDKTGRKERRGRPKGRKGGGVGTQRGERDSENRHVKETFSELLSDRSWAYTAAVSRRLR